MLQLHWMKIQNYTQPCSPSIIYNIHLTQMSLIAKEHTHVHGLNINTFPFISTHQNNDVLHVTTIFCPCMRAHHFSKTETPDKERHTQTWSWCMRIHNLSKNLTIWASPQSHPPHSCSHHSPLHGLLLLYLLMASFVMGPSYSVRHLHLQHPLWGKK